MRKSFPGAVNQLPKSLLTTAKQMPDWLDDHAEQINSKDWETQLPGTHFWWIGLIKFFKFLTRYLSALLLPVLNRCLQKYFPKFLLFAFHEWKMKILAILAILGCRRIFWEFFKIRFLLVTKNWWLSILFGNLSTEVFKNGFVVERFEIERWSFLWFSY